MKKRFFLLMFTVLFVMGSFFIVESPCYAEAQDEVVPGNAFIAKGTVFHFELMTALDSKTSKVGDPVEMKLLNDIVVDNVVVIPAQTVLTGKLKKVQASKLAGQGAVIRALLNDYILPNGSALVLNKKDVKFKGDRSYTGIASSVLLPFSGLFFKGKQVKCPEGMNFEYTLEDDIDLGIRSNRLAQAMKKNV